MTRLKPRMPVPPLGIESLDGDVWRLGDKKPEHFTLVAFYCGFHSLNCKGYIRDLDGRINDFRNRGVEVIAISGDSRSKAEQSKQEWGLRQVKLGYGLTIPQARQWGLYVSTGMEPSEPREFAEPALFLVSRDGTLYASSVNTMPFARPSLGELSAALDFIIEKNYPARGEA